MHRKADARDRRRVIVHITRRGRALQRRLSEAIASEREAIFADVGELRSVSCSTRSPSSSAPSADLDAAPAARYGPFEILPL